MVVGILKVRLTLREARSLKDKRRTLRSLKDRLRGSFNVSIAEVDAQDMIQSAVLAVAAVSQDGRYVQGMLGQSLNLMKQCRDAQIADHSIELMHC